MDYIAGALPGLEFWMEVGVAAGLMLVAFIAGTVAHAVLFAVLGRFVDEVSTPWSERLVHYARKPSRLILPLLAMSLVAPSLELSPRVVSMVGHVLQLLFIASIGYLLIRLIRGMSDFVLSRYDTQVQDNLSARRVHTQVHVLERILYAIVIVATISFMLMTFEGLRQVGVSILASAGIGGLALGLAAQQSLGNLIAGIQIAVTQPLTLDDVVIVEGEWGVVEEITLTYVVVRIWDERRLMLPITYFIQTPFENWTRTSADLLGTVLLYTDYTVPVEGVRAELDRLLKTTDLWDGKVAGVQVTDCRPEVLEVRLLVSASDSGRAWELRCFLREKMVEFIQENHPASLPRVRAELERGIGAEA